MLVSPSPGEDHGAIQLYNSDGSDSEISGNGTRCAAAFLLDNGLDSAHLRIATGAGSKHLRLLSRDGPRFEFEMNMGEPRCEPGHIHYRLPLASAAVDATILNVGNPQCAVFVDEFPPHWRQLGKEIESHPLFPQRTNVSFVRPAGPHAIEVLFWERGAGETMSSGTGSTGAAAAAILRKLVQSPIEVKTPAGSLPVRLDGNDLYLTGPAEIIARGEFYMKSEFV
jgi:diaminopimelate epimerase